MAMKRCSTFPKAPALLEHHHQIVLCHIQDTRWARGGGLTRLQPQPTGQSSLFVRWCLLLRFLYICNLLSFRDLIFCWLRRSIPFVVSLSSLFIISAAYVSIPNSIALSWAEDLKCFYWEFQSLFAFGPNFDTIHIYIYIYILSSTDRLFRCIRTPQCG